MSPAAASPSTSAPPPPTTPVASVSNEAPVEAYPSSSSPTDMDDPPHGLTMGGANMENATTSMAPGHESILDDPVTKSIMPTTSEMPPMPPFEPLLTIAPSTLILTKPNGGVSHASLDEGFFQEREQLSTSERSEMTASTEQSESGHLALNQKATLVLTKKKSRVKSKLDLAKMISFRNNKIFHKIAEGRRCQIESLDSETQDPCQATRNDSGSPGKTKDSPQKAVQLIQSFQATIQLNIR
ncbi:hypothetical protein V6N11_002041 [Hibiscus sabdariffa]|uniref:Uncharacterized protein n=1 Tax=Hibiscus sabdariffa TaxID=183260 RepID=A0ABR2QUB0_9ROSI